MPVTSTLKRTRTSRQAKSAQLLRTGVVVFTEKGFHNTSLDELAAAAQVPKGSFAYYFGSKDGYALGVIDAYANYFNRKLDSILSDVTVDPLTRLEKFMDEAIRGMERFEFKRGCLVGNLGQELAALNDPLRQALLVTLRGWQVRIQVCLEEAQRTGQLSPDRKPAQLGKFFWSAWEGAVLSAKLERSPEPLQIVKEMFMSQLRVPAGH